jgi:hypothetical protein
METTALLREAFDAVHTEILEHEDGCPPDCGDIPHLYNARTALQVLIDRHDAAEAALAKADALRDASAELATFKASEVRDWMLQVLLTATDAYRAARPAQEPPHA